MDERSLETRACEYLPRATERGVSDANGKASRAKVIEPGSERARDETARNRRHPQPPASVG
jgi:hypothetical protein